MENRVLNIGNIFPKFEKKAVVSTEKGKEFKDITSEDHKKKNISNCLPELK